MGVFSEALELIKNKFYPIYPCKKQFKEIDLYGYNLEIIKLGEDEDFRVILLPVQKDRLEKCLN